METIREIPLLILDDLGAHNSTPWAQEKLFQILNHRYNNRLATVITTNQPLDDLDPRIASRLVDTDLSRALDIPVPDFRKRHLGGGLDRGGRNLSTLGLHADQTFESYSPRSGDLPQKSERTWTALSCWRAPSLRIRPVGWCFSGTYGCGKTHLAAAIANYQIIRDGPSPMFVVVPDLLDHLRATFSPTSTTTLDRVFEQVRTAPLLILDDLGTESATPWAQRETLSVIQP